MGDSNPRDHSRESYLRLRRVVGLLGVLLPVVLVTWDSILSGGLRVLPSISDYYAFRTRDAFVGVLCTLAWFFLTYRYDREDDLSGNLACVLALGIALFPNSGAVWERIVHFGSAIGFFLVLAYFSLCLFTRSCDDPTDEKLARNRVYRTCGIVMLSCLVMLGVYFMWLRDTGISGINPVFWLESIALWAFGVSWFVKGETVLRDRDET